MTVCSRIMVAFEGTSRNWRPVQGWAPWVGAMLHHLGQWALCFLEVLRSHLHGGFIMLDTHMIDVDICWKTPQIPPHTQCIFLQLSSHFKRKKLECPETRIWFEKNQVYLQILNLVHEKCTWPFKNEKLHRKQKIQYVPRTKETISKMHQTYTGTKHGQKAKLRHGRPFPSRL